MKIITTNYDFNEIFVSDSVVMSLQNMCHFITKIHLILSDYLSRTQNELVSTCHVVLYKNQNPAYSGESNTKVIFIYFSSFLVNDD